jgi:hypothetical protein
VPIEVVLSINSPSEAIFICCLNAKKSDSAIIFFAVNDKKNHGVERKKSNTTFGCFYISFSLKRFPFTFVRGACSKCLSRRIFKPSGFTWRLGKCDQTYSSFSSQVASLGGSENAIRHTAHFQAK